MPRDWSWREKGRPPAGDPVLRYEPGSLGDFLKGCWAIAVVEAALRKDAGHGPPLFQWLDLFAGAPAYPLSAAAAARLDAFPDFPYARAQAAWRARGEVASTGLLISAAAARLGTRPLPRVFDRDAARREAWRRVPEAELLDGRSAEEIARRETPGAGGADLVLVDPYDLFDRWGAWLPWMARWAARVPVLAYACNKVPRSAGHLDQYRRFRSRLEKAVPPGSAWLLGRVPGDPVLPRVWHEAYLLAPNPLMESASPALRDVTLRLAARLAEAGAVEGG